MTGDLKSVPISVARAPHLTVLQWLREVGATYRQPSAPGTPIRQLLTADSRQVLGALSTPGLDRLPNALTPIDLIFSSAVAQYATRLRETDSTSFRDEINVLWNGEPPPFWRDAAKNPREWLDAAARASCAAWSVLAPRWRSAEVQLVREEARVGIAAVTGTIDTLISAISPRLAVEGEEIGFRGGCATAVSFGPRRRLAFVPMLGPRNRMIVSFDQPGIAYIAYGLPGVDRMNPKSPVSSKDRLVVLLGPIRAAALRALGRPQTMGSLAETLHCARSTLTYHCDQLAASGLVQRHRRGQSIWISRTQRAIALLHALE